MSDEEKLLPQAEQHRLGQDEINLTEFPIALLADRVPRTNPKSRRFSSGDKVWEIVGHADYGLPTRLDMELYVVLTELTREQGFPERVQFTRHDLLRRLGWGTDARRYARLQQALDCWVGVTIRSTNSFYDKTSGKWLRHHAFHLLEEYQVHERGHGITGDTGSEPASWFRWSDTIRRNMKARYLKPLDVVLFLNFRSAVTQALYRYLDAKRLNGKVTFQQSLIDLGKQHLGMPASYYPSQIKRELDEAHRELVEVGFLESAHYEPMRSGGGDKVVYHFARRRGPLGLPAARVEGESGEVETAEARPRAVEAKLSPGPAAPPPAAGTRKSGGRASADEGVLESNFGADSLDSTGGGMQTKGLHSGQSRGGRGGERGGTRGGRGGEALDPVVAQLIEQGVTAAAAVELVEERRDECERQLAYLPYREGLQNPGGALRRAIEAAWPAPEGWKRAQARAQRQAKARARRANAAAEAQAVEAEAVEAEAAFARWWAGLSPAEQEARREQATAELFRDNPLAARHCQRHPHRLEEAIRPLLMQQERAVQGSGGWQE